MQVISLVGVVVWRPKISDGKCKCSNCGRTILQGENFRQVGTTNQRGNVEYWVNQCKGCEFKS